jgi:predicted nucleic acid-binding protein
MKKIGMAEWLSYSKIVLVDDEIARKAAEIKRIWSNHSGKNLKLPDALIAATAILHDAVLIGNNNRDFLYLSEFHGLRC